MKKMIKKVPLEEMKSKRLELRLTEANHILIKKMADVRNLSVSDFMLRAALGRKADISFQTGLINELRQCKDELRNLRKFLFESGQESPDDAIEEIIDNLNKVALKISR
jgi:uncharacterized protein (DUF1778 family)